VQHEAANNIKQTCCDDILEIGNKRIPRVCVYSLGFAIIHKLPAEEVDCTWGKDLKVFFFRVGGGG
jgi:hypothetical protein